MYDKTVGKLKRRKLFCALISLIGLCLAFIPFRWVTVPLGIILCFVIYLILSLKLVATPINKTLFYEMDAEKFLYLSYCLGFGGRICDMYADYYRGKYDKAIEIIEQSLPTAKKNVFRYEYSLQLAYCYFEKGDMDGLKRALEEIDLIPCKSKREISLKENSAFLTEFLKRFANGEYDVCKEMKISESCTNDVRSVPALINRIKLYDGIANYMNGNIEEASSAFNEVEQSCPHIYFSQIARYYLTGERESNDSSFATIGDIKRQNVNAHRGRKINNRPKKAVAILCACTVIILIVSLVLLLPSAAKGCNGTGKPSDPYTVISNNDEITRVVDILPINTDGDALCIYIDEGALIQGITHPDYYAQNVGIAYLDRIGDDLYKYGISVRFERADKKIDSSLYKISAPDIGRDVYFRIVGERKDIPSDTMISKEFYVLDESYYLCYIKSPEADVSEYSFEKVQES